MPIVADSAVAVRGDMSKFQSDVASGVNKSVKQAEGLGGRLSSLLSPKNLLIGGGIAAAGATAIGFLTDAVGAASDLNETVSKSGQIFGQEALPGLEEWAETASESFGQSKRAALDAAATFATFGKGAGLAGEDLVGFSTDLTELASDLASFHNASPEEAVTAIGAALRGESEPIRRFGVLLDDATLKARAMKLGIIETTTQALTPQQKVLAAQAEILEQTADAQGDFARTADGLANTQRTNAAKMEDANAKIGESLLPLVQMFSELGGAVIPLLADVLNLLLLPVRALTDAFESLGEVTDNFAMDFGDMGDRIHKISDNAGEDFQAVKDFIKEDMEATGHSFEEAADAADEHFGTITTATDQLVAESGEAWDTYQSQIGAAGEKVEEHVSGFVGTIVEKMEQGRVHVVDVALRLPGEMAQALRDGREEWKQALIQLQTDVEEQGDKASRIAALKAALVGDQLVAGLASKDPLIHAQALHAYMLIQDQLSREGAYGWGSAIAKAWADGLASRWGYAHAKAVYLGTALSGPLEGYSPPKEGPLKDIDKWGANVGDAWADGLTGAANLGLASLHAPSTTGSPMAPASVMPGGGGDTYQWILNVEGVPKVIGSKQQAVEELERMGETWG